MRFRATKLMRAAGSRPLSLLVVAAAVGMALIAQAAFGATGGSTVFEEVKVVNSASNAQTSSTAWVDLPGASTSVTLQTGEQDLIIARFTAESACSGGTGPYWCGVRVLIGGQEANPAAGTDFAFDSTGLGAENASSWESHSIERSLNYYNGGCSSASVPIKVQYRASNAATTLRMDDWHLTVERFHQGGPNPC